MSTERFVVLTVQEADVLVLALSNLLLTLADGRHTSGGAELVTCARGLYDRLEAAIMRGDWR